MEFKIKQEPNLTLQGAQSYQPFCTGNFSEILFLI